MCAAPLAEPRGALIRRQHIRVAMRIGRCGRACKPSAGGEGDNAFGDLIGNQCARHAASARVENADQIPGGDPPRGGILRVQAQRLGACAGHIGQSRFQLAMEFIRWLGGDEMQRRVALRRAQPLIGGQPDRMTGAILIAETVNRGGEDLDLA